MSALTRQQQALIRLYARHSHRSLDQMAKVVWEAFGIDLIRFGALLGQVMWLPEAEAFDAMAVRRYRRLTAGHRHRGRSVEQTMADRAAVDGAS